MCRITKKDTNCIFETKQTKKKTQLIESLMMFLIYLQYNRKLLGGVPVLHAHRQPNLKGRQLLSEERTMLWT